MSFSLRRVFALPVAIVLGFGVAWTLPEDWLFVEKRVSRAGGAGADTEYACPMFCTILSELPEDEACPVCGMELGPVSPEALLDRHERKMVGLQAERLNTYPLHHELELVGEVEFDEREVTVVSARAAGWIEKVSSRATWEAVADGEVLLELYSPEIYAAQRELLVAQHIDESMRGSAREKLELFGLSDEDITKTLVDGRANRRIPIRSPRAGVLVRRGFNEGAHMRAGDELFAVADLRRPWLQLEAFERDLPWLVVGRRLELRSGVEGAASIDAEVAFVDPVIDRRARTTRVRVEVTNRMLPGGKWALMPGQRVEATARIGIGADGRPFEDDRDPAFVLALPRSAVIHTGERSVVYVLYRNEEDAQGEKMRVYDLDPDALPRQVGYELVEVLVGPLGQRADTNGRGLYYPLIEVVPPAAPIDPVSGAMSGEETLQRLEAGHVVVTHGAMLLDSQAQLAGRPSLLYPGGRGAQEQNH